MIIKKLLTTPPWKKPEQDPFSKGPIVRNINSKHSDWVNKVENLLTGELNISGEYLNERIMNPLIPGNIVGKRARELRFVLLVNELQIFHMISNTDKDPLEPDQKYDPANLKHDPQADAGYVKDPSPETNKEKSNSNEKNKKPAHGRCLNKGTKSGNPVANSTECWVVEDAYGIYVTSLLAWLNSHQSDAQKNLFEENLKDLNAKHLDGPAIILCPELIKKIPQTVNNFGSETVNHLIQSSWSKGIQEALLIILSHELGHHLYPCRFGSCTTYSVYFSEGMADWFSYCVLPNKLRPMMQALSDLQSLEYQYYRTFLAMVMPDRLPWRSDISIDYPLHQSIDWFKIIQHSAFYGDAKDWDHASYDNLIRKLKDWSPDPKNTDTFGKTYWQPTFSNVQQFMDAWREACENTSPELYRLCGPKDAGDWPNKVNFDVYSLYNGKSELFKMTNLQEEKWLEMRWNRDTRLEW
ncbi:MAG: hypothetical protein WCJ37_03905 [Syntrophus sp. (in: bacteria)]